MLDNLDPAQQPEPINSGGAAPAEHQCRHTKTDGQPCRNWVVRGQDFCHKHDLFLRARPERPIDVPLLEDEDSIVLLLSETLRALAWGAIPVANGRALLDGCRLAHAIHSKKLETAKFRFRVRQMGIPQHEIFGGHPEPTAASQESDGNFRPEQDTPEPGPKPGPEPAPLTTPLIQPPDPRYHRFRDLKKNWNKELVKVEKEMGDMVAPRYGETRDDFNDSRALPFDHLAEMDREVEKARAMAAALTAKNESEQVNN
jgi:hypothetical protein